MNKKISELLRKALRGKKLLEPFFAFGEIHSNPQIIFHIRYFLYCMENSLADIHPELVCEWSDSNLPLTPDIVTYGSKSVVEMPVWTFVERKDFRKSDRQKEMQGV